jgi:nitrite reductase (NADH) small subunit
MSTFRPICPWNRLPVDRGVAALVDGEQIAVFRTSDHALYAVSNRDPFTDAMVISRGIVGSRGDRATVASPLFKQVFDLASGACLDEPSASLTSYPVRLREGVVEIALRADALSA